MLTRKPHRTLLPITHEMFSAIRDKKSYKHLYDSVDLLKEKISIDEWGNYPNRPHGIATRTNPPPPESVLSEWLITMSQRELIQQYYAFKGYYFYRTILPTTIIHPSDDKGLGIIGVDYDITKVIQVVFANGSRGDDRILNKLISGKEYIDSKILPFLHESIRIEQMIIVESATRKQLEGARIITMPEFYREKLATELNLLKQEDWGWLKLRYDKLLIAFEALNAQDTETDM